MCPCRATMWLTGAIRAKEDPDHSLSGQFTCRSRLIGNQFRGMSARLHECGIGLVTAGVRRQLRHRNEDIDDVLALSGSPKHSLIDETFHKLENKTA